MVPCRGRMFQSACIIYTVRLHQSTIYTFFFSEEMYMTVLNCHVKLDYMPYMFSF